MSTEREASAAELERLGDDYEICPDCRGTRYRHIVLREANDYFPRQTSIEPCRRCAFTGVTMKDGA